MDEYLIEEHHENETALPDTFDMRKGEMSLSMLFIFGTMAIGALVRQILKKYHFPYTVIMFLVGAILGLFAYKYKGFSVFTAIANVDSEIIMQLFLPILIFESAYSTDAHMFMTSIWQSLTLALPGLIFCTALTAVYAESILSPYQWDWTIAFIYGSILSATDPVAVVALLKESGITQTLTTLIEGESLLNDGSAIVIFEVLLSFKKSGAAVLPVDQVILKFVAIALGTPIFGYLMGMITVRWLGSVYKDPVIEFIITLCSAYLTYYTAQTVLHISSVLAVVVLGIVISYNRTSFEPNTQETVHKFWETLTYFANTLIFVIVGVIVTEKALGNISVVNLLFSVCTYFTISVFRMLMVLVFSPVLTRVGYGLPWKHAIILIWGGLRGAVGLALSMILIDVEVIDEEKIARRIREQISIVVLLTLVVNGTTMKYLLKVLGMSGVSLNRRIAMAHAVDHLRQVVSKMEDAIKRDKFFNGANWLWVENYSRIVDPYSPNDDIDPACLYAHNRKVECQECHTEQRLVPTDTEKEEMFEEARLRILAALKVVYWNYFVHGLISRRTVRILISSVDDAADKPGKFVDFKRLRVRYMSVPRVLLYLHTKLVNISETLHVDIAHLPYQYLTEMYEQSRGYRRTCIGLYKSGLFEPIIFIIIILNAITITIGIMGSMHTRKSRVFLFFLNGLFVAAYISEAVIKMNAIGYRKYFRSMWNRYSFFVAVAAVIDYVADYCFLLLNLNYHSYVAMTRLIRLIRLVELYRVLMTALTRLVFYLKYLTSKRLYEAFDLGYGYIHAQHEVMEKIDFVVDYEPCGSELKQISEIGVLHMLTELTAIKRKHFEIADAHKSYSATKKILNDLKSALAELKEDGVVDEIESKFVEQVVDKAIYDVMIGIKYPPPCKTAQRILKRVDWLADKRLLNTLLDDNEMRCFEAHQIVNDVGSKPHGLFVIKSGVVQVCGTIQRKTETLPNVDSLLYFANEGMFSDYIVSFETLGLLGYLQGTPYITTAICETHVDAIYISERTMSEAEEEMIEPPTLEYLLWRNISLRIAERIILELPAYERRQLSKVRLMLENAILPDMSNATKFEIGPGINDIVLIQGIAHDEYRKIHLTGPTYVPKSLGELFFDKSQSRVVMVILAEESYLLKPELDWSGIDSIPSQDRLCLLHTVQHRRKTVTAYLEKTKKRKTKPKHQDSEIELLSE